MDLHNILNSPDAPNIQLVVNAADLKKCFEDFTNWGMERIKERDEPTNYSRKELKYILHVSDSTLNKYREKGIIPEPITINGRVLYNKAEIRHALESRKIKIRKQ